MNLTQPQLVTLKNWLLANAAGLPDDQAKSLLNATASPDYWVWRSAISRAQIYHSTGPGNSTWDWNAYKAQSQGEQGAWTQMFMGDSSPMGNLNFRKGVFSIFSGSGAQNAQRAHIFGVGRRLITVGEKLYSVAVVGGTTDTGNDNGTRGTTTNPDNFGVGLNGSLLEGEVSLANISEALNQP